MHEARDAAAGERADRDPRLTIPQGSRVCNLCKEKTGRGPVAVPSGEFSSEFREFTVYYLLMRLASKEIGFLRVKRE